MNRAAKADERFAKRVGKKSRHRRQDGGGHAAAIAGTPSTSRRTVI
jgi:hypothetical protein